MSNTADVGYETNGYTLREAIVEAKRCLNCKKPMCRTGCPISNNIPEFIDALSHGDLGKASMIIAQRSNLPAVVEFARMNVSVKVLVFWDVKVKE